MVDMQVVVAIQQQVTVNVPVPTTVDQDVIVVMKATMDSLIVEVSIA